MAASVLDGRKIVLGTAEIRVRGAGVTYAAPNLIYHYCESHQYLPPPEFITACESRGSPQADRG